MSHRRLADCNIALQRQSNQAGCGVVSSHLVELRMNLWNPLIHDVIQGRGVSDVIHQYKYICPGVREPSQVFKGLLACSVPELHLDPRDWGRLPGQGRGRVAAGLASSSWSLWSQYSMKLLNVVGTSEGRGCQDRRWGIVKSFGARPAREATPMPS